METSNQLPPDQDPLAMPAGGVAEPEYPVLKAGLYDLVIRDVEQKTSEKEGKSPYTYLAITLHTTKETLDTEGLVRNAGFVVRGMVGLTPNEQNSAQQVAAQAAMFVKAALGPSTKVSVRDVINNPGLVKDKIAKVKLDIRKGKDGYSDSNVVKSWIVPTAAA